MIDTAKTRLDEAEKQQKTVQDMIYGRNGQATTVGDWNKILEGMRFKIAGNEYDSSNFKLPSDLGVINWMSPEKGDSVAKFLAESFQDEYAKIFERLTYAYAAAGLPPPVRPEQLRPEDFDEQLITHITAKIFKALEEQAIEASNAVSKAQQYVAQFAPLQERLNREAADSARRMAEPLNIDPDDPYYGYTEFDKDGPIDYISRAKEIQQAEGDLAFGRKRLSDLEAALNGVLRGGLFPSPTDALTRIGGGGGYSSYNDSTARIQKSIETNLRTLVANQKSQNEQIIDLLENLRWEDNTPVWQD